LAVFYFRIWQLFTSWFGEKLLPDLALFILEVDPKVQFNPCATKSPKHERTQNMDIQLNKICESLCF
jgi:hypothetical protein